MMRKLDEFGGFGLMSEQWDGMVWDRPMWRLADGGDGGAAPGKPIPPSIMSDFPAVVDLDGLTLPTGFVIRGDAAGDIAGVAVSSAGDINNDGFDDIIVGAARGDNGGNLAGEAYVIFGKASGFGAIDLTNLTIADGFIIQGDMGGADTMSDGDYAGRAVASAGDINGDGFDDIIVGAPNGDDGGEDAGEAYVIFGKAAGFSNIDLSLLGTAEGFIIQGAAAGENAGYSVSSAGDINGDGLDDIVVGAPRADIGATDTGTSYVIFGKATTFDDIDLAMLAPADGFAILGAAEDDRSGFDVASAGDVNGDGFDDLFIGARNADEGGMDAGLAYVVFGKGEPFATIDLALLGTDEGFRIIGDAEYDFAGLSIAGAGDINGDGIDDMIVGAPGGDDGGDRAGEAYVVFGKGGIETIDLATLNPTDPNHDPAAGFIIRGDAAVDYAGFDVSTAGDVNGDGFDDIILGAPAGDNGGNQAGEAYVIFGKAAGFGLIDLTILDVEQGFIIQGDAGGLDTLPGDFAGFSVSTAGDINGDGFDDIIVGAPNGDNGGIDAGEAYVIFGRAPTEAVDRTGSIAAQAIYGGAFNDTLAGLGGNDTLIGAKGSDALDGGTGTDVLAGGGGNDTLAGGTGGDVLSGGSGLDAASHAASTKAVLADLKVPSLNTNEAAGDSYFEVEQLIGSAFNDTLFGDNKANGLFGLSGNDSLDGRFGNDNLDGGKGNDYLNGADDGDTLRGAGGQDTLRGGRDNDRFVLDSANAADRDTILDFSGVSDEIALSGAAFGLTPGALDADAFTIGAFAADAEDRFIYKPGDGKLFFDPDGTGAQAQVLIATLTNTPTLSAGEFVVI